MSEALLAVARAVKTRGLKGEIVAELLTDFPERFDGLKELTAIAPARRVFQLKLERHWFQGPRIVLKFSGYDTPEAAQALVGCELAVPESDAGYVDVGDPVSLEVQSLRGAALTGKVTRTGFSLDPSSRSLCRTRQTSVLQGFTPFRRRTRV